MVSGSVLTKNADVFVTREVRWFQVGPLPDQILDWFTTSETSAEHRPDWYDLRSAGNGVG